MDAVQPNLTRADVTGKVPKNGKGASVRAHKPRKLSAYSKTRVRRLKKSGEISDRAALRMGL